MEAALEEILKMVQLINEKMDRQSVNISENIRELQEMNRRLAALEAKRSRKSKAVHALPTDQRLPETSLELPQDPQVMMSSSPNVALIAQVEVQPQPSTTLEHLPSAQIAATACLTIADAADTSLETKSLSETNNCSSPAVSTDVDQSNHSEAPQASATFQHFDLYHWPLFVLTGMLLPRIKGAGSVILQFDPGGVC